MWLRCAVLLAAVLAAAPRRACAQAAAHDETAVRSAVGRVLASMSNPVDTTREGPDSASVWQRFVHCEARDGRSVCALNQGKPATAIAVHLVTPDSAEVHIQRFQMQYEFCPGGPKLNPPIINGFLGIRTMTLKYADGRWIRVGPVFAIAC